MFILLLILFAFFLVSKSVMLDIEFSSGFECGYYSYFFSRFSYSIHYFIICIIFLFLDLELSFIFIFFSDLLSSYFFIMFLEFFVFFLLLGLFFEWKENQFSWIY